MAIIGAGRLGTALARALRAADVDVLGPLGRGEAGVAAPTSSAAATVAGGWTADAVLLCVPDGEIPAAAAAVHGRARFVGHTSGATPLTALEPARSEAFGLHPLQTFAGGEGSEAFDGAGCAIAGATPAALETARQLAERVAMRPIEISDDDRAAYHAAASIASNFLVTLQSAAEELAAGAGLEPADARALLAPLVRGTVDNWAARGPRDALTGPVARGDDATVERQRRAVEEHAPHLLTLFDELVTCTRALAGEREAVAA
ncbi:MAG: DUF2520 domain-containing protein [Thermoleophilaceae bacterium]